MAAVAELAARLTPAPAALAARPVGTRLAGAFGRWRRLAALAWLRRRLGAQAIVAGRRARWFSPGRSGQVVQPRSPGTSTWRRRLAGTPAQTS